MAIAKKFACGAMKLDLMPEIEAEGKNWRFIGIQSKNRKEWNLIHLANMHIKTTTVALYDTLGVEASKYVIEQTEMTTIATSKDLI
jgi:long-chain acyl-CoA synthetase